jgi:hypothetical protein
MSVRVPVVGSIEYASAPKEPPTYRNLPVGSTTRPSGPALVGKGLPATGMSAPVEALAANAVTVAAEVFKT